MTFLCHCNIKVMYIFINPTNCNTNQYFRFQKEISHLPRRITNSKKHVAFQPPLPKGSVRIQKYGMEKGDQMVYMS